MKAHIRAVDPAEPPVAALFARLDTMHRGLYPPDSNHLQNPPDLASPDFLGSRLGAIRQFRAGDRASHSLRARALNGLTAVRRAGIPGIE